MLERGGDGDRRPVAWGSESRGLCAPSRAEPERWGGSRGPRPSWPADGVGGVGGRAGTGKTCFR